MKKKIFDQSTIKQNLSIFFNIHRSRYNLFFQLKMKTSKGHTLIKCMVLFSIILVAIVLSAVVTGYVSTKNLVEDIPSQVKMDLQKMPEWKILKRLPNNLSQLKHALQLGKQYRTKNNTLQLYEISSLISWGGGCTFYLFLGFFSSAFFIILNFYHIDFKNETKTVSEWLLRRFLNETGMSCTIRNLVNNLLKTCSQWWVVIRNAKLIYLFTISRCSMAEERYS